MHLMLDKWQSIPIINYVFNKISLLIVDETETYPSPIYDESTNIKTEEVTTIYINDINVSTFMNQCFNHLWNEAKPLPPEYSRQKLNLSPSKPYP